MVIYFSRERERESFMSTNTIKHRYIIHIMDLIWPSRMENQTKRYLGMQVFWGCNNDGAHQALSTTPNKAKIE